MAAARVTGRDMLSVIVWLEADGKKIGGHRDQSPKNDLPH